MTAITLYDAGPLVTGTRDEETSTMPPGPSGEVEGVGRAEVPKITPPEPNAELSGTEIVLVFGAVPERPKIIPVDIASGLEAADGTKTPVDIGGGLEIVEDTGTSVGAPAGLGPSEVG